ncbi:unnamed protein product [Auanema sp. JU1783]|nr:unnamed protein product [Auanema sp. JU1783]
MVDNNWGHIPAPSSSVSTGSLKTKISLKAGSSYTVVSPFYTMKPELPLKTPMLGNVDLLEAYDLGPSYSKYCLSRKTKGDLSSFLPHIYGNFNMAQAQEISSLKHLVEKPPISKEVHVLTSNAMIGFRLATGAVDDRYRHLFDRKKDQDSEVEKRDFAFRYKPVEPMTSDKLDARLTLSGDDYERRKHKSEKKEKKKKKDKKKKDKKDEDRKHKKDY